MKRFHALTMIWLPAFALLGGCSNNKPGDDDIQAALAPFYECPAFELRDVKKLNGEPGANGTYEGMCSRGPPRPSSWQERAGHR